MKTLIEYINETKISNEKQYNESCEEYSVFSIEGVVNRKVVDLFTQAEYRKLYNFFPDSNHKVCTGVQSFYNDPAVKIALSRTEGEHKLHIVKYKNSSKNYYGLLCRYNDNFECKNKASNKYFDKKEYEWGKYISSSGKVGPKDVHYVFYFKTLNSLFKQILNKAIEIANSNNIEEKEIINYVREENLPKEIQPSNVINTKWNELLKKYNINENTDVIIYFYDKTQDKIVGEENWGKFDIALFDKFAKEERSHRYSDNVIHFKDKHIEELYDFWYKSKSNGEKINLYYGNGTVD